MHLTKSMLIEARHFYILRYPDTDPSKCKQKSKAELQLGKKGGKKKKRKE